MERETHIKDLGGWDDVEFMFSPGWSTGPKDGPWNDGVGIEAKFNKPYHVGGFMNHREIGRWNGGGVIKKEQAIKLARSILTYYGEIPKE